MYIRTDIHVHTYIYIIQLNWFLWREKHLPMAFISGHELDNANTSIRSSMLLLDWLPISSFNCSCSCSSDDDWSSPLLGTTGWDVTLRGNEVCKGSTLSIGAKSEWLFFYIYKKTKKTYEEIRTKFWFDQIRLTNDHIDMLKMIKENLWMMTCLCCDKTKQKPLNDDMFMQWMIKQNKNLWMITWIC